MLSYTHELAHAATLPAYSAPGSADGTCTQACDELRAHVRLALRLLPSRERALLARYYDRGMVGGLEPARERMAADLGLTLDGLHAEMDALRARVSRMVRDFAAGTR